MYPVGLLAAILGCRTAPLPVAAEAPRTVVWVSMDTMRADATGPAFDVLAGRGLRFTAAMSAAPTTLASHASMFTGLYPHSHGVPRNEHRLSPIPPTVAERLGAAGYRTGAFLGAMPLGAHTGLVRDFGYVDERFDRARGGLYEQTERRGQAVTDAALAWLEGQPGRVFLFVHWFDAHQPYTPDAAFEPGGASQATMDDVFGARVGRSALSDRQLEGLYRAEAAQVDHELGRLMAGLERVGRNDALVVVVADHGESLAARKEERWDHGWRVFDDTVHVPLAIAGDGVAKGVVDVPVSLVDLAPTVLGRVGVPVASMEGVDLGPALEGDPLARGPVFTEATKPLDPPADGWINGPRWKAASEGQWKLHWDPKTGRELLFDLSVDPGERRDRSGDPEAKGALERLRGELRRWADGAEPLPTERVSDREALEQLRRLGYLE